LRKAKTILFFQIETGGPRGGVPAGKRADCGTTQNAGTAAIATAATLSSPLIEGAPTIAA
jgi:hypothetical protein